jgi:hypothetical protein
MESLRYKPKVYNVQCNSDLIDSVHEKSSLHKVRLLGVFRNSFGRSDGKDSCSSRQQGSHRFGLVADTTKQEPTHITNFSSESPQ